MGQLIPPQSSGSQADVVTVHSWTGLPISGIAVVQVAFFRTPDPAQSS